MDFTYDEQQQAIYDLADQILGDKMTMDRLMEIDQSGEWFDEDAWSALATAGLTGVSLREDVGGGGTDITGAAMVAQAAGSHVAPTPLLPTTLASLAIDEFGSDELRQDLLPGVVDGSRILTVAIQEYMDDAVRRPATTFDGATVSGTKIVVEFAERATHAVVSVRAGDDDQLAVVDLSGDGIIMTEGRSTRTDAVHEIEFDEAPAVVLAGGSVDWLVDRAVALNCMTQLGVTEKALRMTADYTTTREQFGRPIATFQAVTQRLADQFINVQGIRMSSIAAIWRLANDQDARTDLHVAKWWASERAVDIAHATQHCHGGMGVSIDYPLHRYTLWNKHLTVSLGAGTQTLRALGAELAAS